MTAPIPARVDASIKDVLLGLVDHATEAGWPCPRRVICSGCAGGGCDAGSPAATTATWLMPYRVDGERPDPGEIEAILGLFDPSGEKDRWHRG